MPFSNYLKMCYFKSAINIHLHPLNSVLSSTIIPALNIKDNIVPEYVQVLLGLLIDLLTTSRFAVNSWTDFQDIERYIIFSETLSKKTEI